PELQSLLAFPNTSDELQLVQQGLAKHDVVPLLRVTETLRRHDDALAQRWGLALREVARAYSFQQARYEGDLQGTEVGMNLFYTDLLTKLWALDYKKTAPVQHITEFPTLAHLRSEIINSQGRGEPSSSRIWLGHDKN